MVSYINTFHIFLHFQAPQVFFHEWSQASSSGAGSALLALTQPHSNGHLAIAQRNGSQDLREITLTAFKIRVFEWYKIHKVSSVTAFGNHAENRQLSKSTQKKTLKLTEKIHTLPMKHPFSNQPAWLRNWEKNMAIFWRVLPPPTWLGRSVRRFGGRRPWLGTNPRNPRQFEKGSGPPPNATGLSNTADPLKSWSHQDVEDISRGEKSAFSLGGADRNRASKQHPKKHMKWCFTANPSKGTSAIFQTSFPLLSVQCPRTISKAISDQPVELQFSISGAGFCTIKYPAYRP